LLEYWKDIYKKQLTTRMKIKNTSKIKNFFIKFLNKAIIKLEDKGNANFNTNGEQHFINDLIKYYNKKNNEIVIFDIGANTGNYSSYIIKCAKENKLRYIIHMFEPTTSCFKTLENKFGFDKNIALNNFGISNQECEKNIYYDKEKSGLSSLYKRNLEAYGTKMDKSEIIKLKRLDEYIKEKGIKKINLLKIDIEGHELMAINGLGKYLDTNNIDFIQFEYGGCNIDSQTTLFQIYTILENSGFIICKITPKYLEKRKYSKSMEDYVYSNYVAVSPTIISEISLL